MAGRPPPLPQGLATITVLKGMIGTGILGLPYVCGRVHLGLAAPGMVGTAAVGAFSVWRLIECKNLLAGELHDGDRSDFGSDSELSKPPGASGGDGTATMGLGPLAVVGWQAFGHPGVAVAAFGILASQLGFAVSYVDVIIETLSEPTLLGSVCSTFALRVGICAVLCGLCLLRRLSSLAWLSGAALLIYAYLLAALLYYGGRELASEAAPDASEAWLPVRWNSFGAWFGTAIFAQEAIVISQYVYDDMQLSDRRLFLPVLLSSFGISGALFTFVGVFGYLSYGDSVKSVFYLNFPADSPAVAIGEVVLCLVLLFSFALQMYPVMSFLEATLLGLQPGRDVQDELGGEDSRGLVKGQELAAESSGDEEESGAGATAAVPVGATALLRCVAVASTCVAAAMVPNLACVSGYSGCFAMSSIGFFMPSLCHIKLHGGRLSPLQWLGNAVLLLAGCAAIVFGLASISCS